MFDNACFSRNSTRDDILNAWDALTCWQYPTNDTSIFSFESLLRGFVPRDLSNTLALIHSKKVVSEIITETLSIAKQAFKQQVWAYRCEQLQEFEQACNITYKDKRDKRRASTSRMTRPSNTTSFSLSTPHTTNNSRWKV